MIETSESTEKTSKTFTTLGVISFKRRDSKRCRRENRPNPKLTAYQFLLYFRELLDVYPIPSLQFGHERISQKRSRRSFSERVIVHGHL